MAAMGRKLSFIYSRWMMAMAEFAMHALSEMGWHRELVCAGRVSVEMDYNPLNKSIIFTLRAFAKANKTSSEGLHTPRSTWLA